MLTLFIEIHNNLTKHLVLNFNVKPCNDNNFTNKVKTVVNEVINDNNDEISQDLFNGNLLLLTVIFPSIFVSRSLMKKINNHPINYFGQAGTLSQPPSSWSACLQDGSAFIVLQSVIILATHRFALLWR